MTEKSKTEKTANSKTKAAAKKTYSKSSKKTSGKTSPKSPTKEKKEQQDWKDKYLRLSADFDNYRKRTLKEKADLTKFAGEEILRDFLPVADDMDRAIQSMETTRDLQSLEKGILLISSKLSDFLTKEGIQEIECLHKSFDPESHEALTKIPAPKKNLKGKVIDVIEKGYYLKGKIIRYPKVVVGE